MIDKLTVLLLAGARSGADPICSARHNRYKSLVRIAGKPMIMHTLEGLSAASRVERIIVLTQEPERFQRELAEFKLGDKVSFYKSGSCIIPSILEARDHLSLGWPLLVTTADNCLLRDYHIDDFLANCTSTQSDIALGFLQKDRVLADYPDAKRTWIRFSDTELTGCNLFLLKSDKARLALEFWKGFEASPKKFLKTAWALGPLFFWRHLTRSMSVDETFKKLSQLTRCNVQPVLLDHARIAIDADKLSDIRLIETILGYQDEDLLKINAGQRFAIFDLDRTITSFGTYTPFLLYYAYRNNPHRLLLIPLAVTAMLTYKAGLITRKKLKEIIFRLMAGTPAGDRLHSTCKRFIDKAFENSVYPGVLEEIKTQQAKGAKLVLATASFDWLAGIFAERLGFDTVVATRSIEHEGRVLPMINGENCYGVDKTTMVEEAIGPIDRLLESGSEVWFYTDHHSDISLLEKCSHPVAVNPDTRLTAWCETTPRSRVMHWSKGKPSKTSHSLRPRVRFSLLTLSILTLTMLVAVLFTSSRTVWPGHDIDMKRVPSAVLETVNSRYPGIVLAEVSIEIDDNVRLFELEGEYRGRIYELKVSSSGEFLQEELSDFAGDTHHIEVSDVPDVIMNVVNNEFPDHVFLEASVKRVENITTYEVELIHKQHKFEIEITVDGVITSVEEEYYYFWQGLLIKFTT